VVEGAVSVLWNIHELLTNTENHRLIVRLPLLP
jgi:hypothetical protein